MKIYQSTQRNQADYPLNSDQKPIMFALGLIISIGCGIGCGYAIGLSQGCFIGTLCLMATTTVQSCQKEKTKKSSLRKEKPSSPNTPAITSSYDFTFYPTPKSGTPPLKSKPEEESDEEPAVLRIHSDPPCHPSLQESSFRIKYVDDVEVWQGADGSVLTFHR